MIVGPGELVSFGDGGLASRPGDRGHMARLGDLLARLQVRRSAIDGETAESLQTGEGRTSPMVGRPDDGLAFRRTSRAEAGGGRTQQKKALDAAEAVRTAIERGLDERAALASKPTGEAPAAIPQAAGRWPLAAYEASRSDALSTIHRAAPDVPLCLTVEDDPLPPIPSQG